MSVHDGVIMHARAFLLHMCMGSPGWLERISRMGWSTAAATLTLPEIVEGLAELWPQSVQACVSSGQAARSQPGREVAAPEPRSGKRARGRARRLLLAARDAGRRLLCCGAQVPTALLACKCVRVEKVLDAGRAPAHAPV